MKKILPLVLVFIFIYGSLLAQQRQPVRRANQPPPPREAPYVKKTDYNADKEALEAQLRSVEALAAKLRIERDSARSTIAMQNARLDSIEQILFQTSLVTQLNSDSLNVTKFSLLQFMNQVKEDQNTMRVEIASQEKALMMWLPLAGLLMLLLIGGGIWHSGKQRGLLSKDLRASQQRLRDQLAAQRDELNDRLTQIEQSLGSKMSSVESSLNRKLTDAHSTLDLKVIETKNELESKISSEVKASKNRFEEMNRELEDRVAELRSDMGNRPAV